jgi:ADP-ribose pyrophosphatase
MVRTEADVAEVFDVQPAFESPWLTVHKATVRRSADLSTWYYLDHPGCALVLRVWRVSVRQWCHEAPAGRIEPTEEPIEAARRELREEIGGDCTELVHLGTVLASSGSSNERVHLYVGRNVRLGQASPDPDERIEVVAMTPDQALDLARSGRIEDAPTALAVLWAHERKLLHATMCDAS